MCQEGPTTSVRFLHSGCSNQLWVRPINSMLQGNPIDALRKFRLLTRCSRDDQYYQMEGLYLCPRGCYLAGKSRFAQPYITFVNRGTNSALQAENTRLTSWISSTFPVSDFTADGRRMCFAGLKRPLVIANTKSWATEHLSHFIMSVRSESLPLNRWCRNVSITSGTSVCYLPEDLKHLEAILAGH